MMNIMLEWHILLCGFNVDIAARFVFFCVVPFLVCPFGDVRESNLAQREEAVLLRRRCAATSSSVLLARNVVLRRPGSFPFWLRVKSLSDDDHDARRTVQFYFIGSFLDAVVAFRCVFSLSDASFCDTTFCREVLSFFVSIFGEFPSSRQ